MVTHKLQPVVQLFSLDLMGCLRRSGLQMREPHDCLLKLIQGMIRQDGSALFIETSQKTISFFLQRPGNAVSGVELAERFEASLALGAEPGPLSDLAVGLAAFAEESPVAVWWLEFEENDGSPSGPSEYRVSEAVRLTGLAQEARAGLPPESMRGRVVALQLERNPTLRKFYSLHDLSRRLAFATIPIYQCRPGESERLLCPNAWSPQPSIERGRPSGPEAQTLVSEYYKVDPSLGFWGIALKPVGRAAVEENPCLPWSQIAGRPSAPGEPSCWIRWLVSDGPVHKDDLIRLSPQLLSSGQAGQGFETATGTHMFLLTDSDRPALLWLVQAGALLTPVPLNIPLPGLHILAAAPEIETDATRLTPLPNEQLVELISSFHSDLVSFLKWTSQRIESYPISGSPWNLGALAGFLLFGMLVSALPELPFGESPVILLGGTWMSSFGYKYRRCTSVRSQTQDRLRLAINWFSTGSNGGQDSRSANQAE